MRGWRLILGTTAIAAAIPTTGCYDMIASHTPVEIQVIDARDNFIDEALAHRHSNRYTIASADTPRFGSRIPVWLIAEQANRRVAADGPERALAHLHNQGCEPTGARSCAYRKVLRKLEARKETERRLVTLHFTLAPNAAKGCTICAHVRLEIGGSVGRKGEGTTKAAPS